VPPDMPEPLPPQLSIVIPVYNEEECIAGVMAELRAVLDKPGLPAWECLVVDDASKDNTTRIALQVAREDARFRILALDRNTGQSAALDAGFRNVRGQIVGMMDGDGQNDPADFPRLLAEMERQGADVVCGIRSKRKDSPWRRLVSGVANAVRNRVTHDVVTDTGCSIRVMNNEYLRRIKMFKGLHRFLPTLLRLEGAKVTEIPVNHRPRKAGVSKYGFRNRVNAARDLFAVHWMRRRRLRYKVRTLTD